MNERIRELAVEADFALFVDGHFYSECQNEMITDQIQKFAELIVGECIKVVDLWCDEVPCSDGYDKFTVSKLKERFGVSDE